VIATFAGIYFILARDDIRAGFAIIPEAHAMIITRMGAFKEVVINWKDHVLTDEWEVKEEPGKGRRKFGGLIWFLFPIEDVKIVKEDVDKASAKISLMDRVIEVEVFRAEDLEGIWTRLEGYIKGRVVNPYRVTFKIEPPWIPKLKVMFEAAMRDAITRHPFLKAIQKKKDMAQEMWQALQKDGVIEEWKERYGFEIVEFGVKNIDVEKAEHYEAMLEKWKGARQAEGVRKRAAGEASAIRIKANAVKAKGDEGRLVVIADAMAKSPLAAAETVHAIPGLGLDKLVGPAFGRKDLEEFLKGVIEGLKGEKKGGD
jgi:regulator of protease activity HflC (stomatin/prohibitin superfamily)